MELLGRYSNQDMIQRKLQALLTLPPLSGDVRSTVVGHKLKQRQRRLTPDEVDTLIADYVAGMKVDNIALKYGIHPATVHMQVKRRGVVLRQPRPKP